MAMKEKGEARNCGSKIVLIMAGAQLELSRHVKQPDFKEPSNRKGARIWPIEVSRHGNGDSEHYKNEAETPFGCGK